MPLQEINREIVTITLSKGLARWFYGELESLKEQVEKDEPLFQEIADFEAQVVKLIPEVL